MTLHGSSSRRICPKHHLTQPKTVNLRIQALNKYLEFTKHHRLKLKSVRVQQRSYLENVISNADYTFLKNKLKREPNKEWYFVVQYLATTGVRVSELVQIKIEHVNAGYFDIHAKGGKFRRIFIPNKLREESEAWIRESGRNSGYLFLNRFAKNFLEKYNDIALLADLMGHESIETTRIYLRKSSLELQTIIDKVVTW